MQFHKAAEFHCLIFTVIDFIFKTHNIREMSHWLHSPMCVASCFLHVTKMQKLSNCLELLLIVIPNFVLDKWQIHILKYVNKSVKTTSANSSFNKLSLTHSVILIVIHHQVQSFTFFFGWGSLRHHFHYSLKTYTALFILFWNVDKQKIEI